MYVCFAYLSGFQPVCLFLIGVEYRSWWKLRSSFLIYLVC